jgi:hypothetical protein
MIMRAVDRSILENIKPGWDMSNPLRLYAITPEQLDALLAEPVKLARIGQWVAAAPRNYAEAYCGLGLSWDSGLSDLVPEDGPLGEEATAKPTKIAHYMMPEKVRAVARKYAGFEIEDLPPDSAVTELFRKEIVWIDLPGLLEFYQAAAEGGKAVVGVFSI